MPLPPARTKLIGPIREMTREDMAATLRKAFTPTIPASALRNSHHRIARMAAAGLRKFEIVERTGYSYNRVSQLLAAPAMQELVSTYRAKVDASYERELDQFHHKAFGNMLIGEDIISDRLEGVLDGDTQMSTRDVIAIVADRADRLGYGKRETRVNVNADFAAELEKAIARSAQVIEVIPEGGKIRRRV